MTTEERKQKKKELFEMYKAYFDSIEKRPYFVPKPIRNEGSGDPYLAASFFENEFEVAKKYGEVYIVNIDYRDMSPIEADNFTLYHWTYNPYWNDPSEGYEKFVITSKNGSSFTKYAIPMEEFNIIGKGKEFWDGYKAPTQQEELPLFDMSAVSGVKPKFEAIEPVQAFQNLEDEGMETKLTDLTAQDLYAIVHRRPVSVLPGINEFINRENNI